MAQSQILSTFVVLNETKFESETARLWMEHNWKWAYFLSAIYLFFIFYGQKIMAKRPPFDLKPYLVIWNTSLAVFSIIGACHLIPDLVSSIYDVGFFEAMCIRTSSFEGDPGYWTWLFILSKAVELGDTVFLVLRKRPVIFLHAYHHISVLLFCWWHYQYLPSATKWGVTTNYVVHSIMYTYYGLRAGGFRMSKLISVLVTIIQISQMVAMTCFASFILIRSLNGADCSANNSVNILQVLMYISYFVLFAKFFSDSYLTGTKSKPNPKVSKKIE